MARQNQPALMRLFILLLSMMFFGCAASVDTKGEPDKSAQQGASAQKLAGGDVSLVLGVKKEAPPPPPVPGAPRSTITTPASYYEPVGPFFFYVETLTSTGPSKYGYTPTQPCIQSGVFKRGMRMV